MLFLLFIGNISIIHNSAEFPIRLRGELYSVPTETEKAIAVDANSPTVMQICLNSLILFSRNQMIYGDRCDAEAAGILGRLLWRGG